MKDWRKELKEKKEQAIKKASASQMLKGETLWEIYDWEALETFIDQLISERDKEWQKEKVELEYKLYMKTDKMYQILTQLENCLHILGKIESQKEHYPTVEDYLKEDESLQAMWRSYRD